MIRRMTSLPSSCSPNKSACGLIWTGERCTQMFQPFIFVKLKKIVLYDTYIPCRLEDLNSSLEKEVSVGKRELEEALGERALLGEVAFSSV